MVLKKRIGKCPHQLSRFHYYISLEIDVTITQRCFVLSLFKVCPNKMKNHDNYEVDDGKWANFDQKYNSKTSLIFTNKNVGDATL